MSTVETAATGSSVGLDDTIEDPTRTIAELVEQAGHLKNQTRILVADTNEVHQSTEELHTESLTSLHRRMSYDQAKFSLPSLLDELSAMGFSWRDIARACGVSVPALRKWRNGAPAIGENRLRVAKFMALCIIARDQYLIDDVASWVETPLHQDAPLTVLDLVAEERLDLALQLASEQGTDPERILDLFDPEWRDHYASKVEVFTGPDGLPGLRLGEGSA